MVGQTLVIESPLAVCTLTKLRILMLLMGVIHQTSSIQSHNSHPGCSQCKAASEAIFRPSCLHFLSSFCFFSCNSLHSFTSSTSFFTICLLSVHCLPAPIFCKTKLLQIPYQQVIPPALLASNRTFATS